MRKVACANTYINKIKPIIRKTSFSQLKIDEIAKYMDISKATLYKRFSSKDEIIEAVVEDFMNYLLEGDADNQDESMSFTERFQKTFIHSLKCVTYISDVFARFERSISAFVGSISQPNKIVTIICKCF